MCFWLMLLCSVLLYVSYFGVMSLGVGRLMGVLLWKICICVIYVLFVLCVVLM